MAGGNGALPPGTRLWNGTTVGTVEDHLIERAKRAWLAREDHYNLPKGSRAATNYDKGRTAGMLEAYLDAIVAHRAGSNYFMGGGERQVEDEIREALKAEGRWTPRG